MKNIVSTSLVVLLSLLLIMSAIMKIAGAEQIVTGLSAMGLGSFITGLGILEICSTILFVLPKTRRIGFLLLCSYLGGAASIELASGQFPIALVFIAIAWTAIYLQDKNYILQEVKTGL